MMFSKSKVTVSCFIGFFFEPPKRPSSSSSSSSLFSRVGSSGSTSVAYTSGSEVCFLSKFVMLSPLLVTVLSELLSFLT